MANIASAVPALQGMQNGSVLDTTLSAMREGVGRLSGGLRLSLAEGADTLGRGEASLLFLGDRASTDLQTLNQATLEANDGIAMTQVAEAGLTDIHGDLLQLQKLVDASHNGALRDEDRSAIQVQARKIQLSIEQKVHSTRYNNVPLLATTKAILLQTGIDTHTQNVLQLKDFSNAFTPVDLTSSAGAEAATASLSKDLATVEQARQQFAATGAELSQSIDTLHAWSLSRTESASRVDALYDPQTVAERIAEMIRIRAADALQVQANQSAARVQHLL
ncbi:MAG: hypothetical protein H7836_00065 [Magnetococcus sp. YQC-3]